MALKRKKGIPLGEFVEMNLDVLKATHVCIDSDWYDYGEGKPSMYKNPDYKSLDDLVWKFRDPELFCTAAYRVVAKIHRLRESGTIFVSTCYEEDYDPAFY